MNAYTTRGQARIQPRDIAAVMLAYPLVGASLAALERQRGDQAESELHLLLKQHCVTRLAATPRMLMLRQTIGATLVRAGKHLAGAPQRGTLPGTAPARGMLGTVD